MTTRDVPRRVRPVRVAKAVAVVDRRPDGTTYLRNPNPLGPYPVALTDRLVEWARKTPGRTLAAAAGRTRRVAAPDLRRRARPRAPRRAGAAGSRPVGGAAGRDAVGQQPRPPGAGPRRHARRHPLRADRAGLFAAGAGVRRAALRLRSDAAGAGAGGGHHRVPARARGRGAGGRGSRRLAVRAPPAIPADAVRDAARHRGHRRGRARARAR